MPVCLQEYLEGNQKVKVRKFTKCEAKLAESEQFGLGSFSIRGKTTATFRPIYQNGPPLEAMVLTKDEITDAKITIRYILPGDRPQVAFWKKDSIV